MSTPILIGRLGPLCVLADGGLGGLTSTNSPKAQAVFGTAVPQYRWGVLAAL
jgi:hypothetical protein